MQVKKFEAPTLQEALETIKRELGPEAIILQTKQHKRGFGLMNRASVEVTAAVSERSMQKKKFTDERLPGESRQVVGGLPAGRQAQLYEKNMDRHLAHVAGRTRDKVEVRSSKPITARRYADIPDEEGAKSRQASRTIPAPILPPEPALALAPARQARAPLAPVLGPEPSGANAVAAATASPGLETELRQLRRMMEDIKNTRPDGVAGGFASPALQDAFDQLIINGVDKRHSIDLMKKVSFELGERAKNADDVLDQLALELMEGTQVGSLLAGITAGKGTSAIALVGPTGVGKTTTVAKIASEAALKRGLKVGLINLDDYKVAAFDQLGTYAKILNVPFRSASSTEDLAAAMQDFSTLDLVLIDTTGRSHRDTEALKEMETLLQAVRKARVQLVLSATTRDAELHDMANRFSVFRPDGLIFSKLDEASVYGGIYNVSQRAKLPLTYFATGQRVPEDIEEATSERLAALIMDL